MCVDRVISDWAKCARRDERTWRLAKRGDRASERRNKWTRCRSDDSTREMATRDPKDSEGDGPLKNGTAAADDSDDSSGAVLGKKSRSPAQHHAMDGFQDGGPPPTSRPPNSMDGYPDPRSQQHYQQQQNFANNNNNNSTNNPDDNSFRPDYPQELGGNSYNRGGFEQQQHGGPGNDVSNSNSNKMYPQQQYMRPPFSARGGGPQRAQPPYGGSRFVSGPSLSQQTGPTPTLNQLLQAPNSLQRYQHNSYDYPKGDGGAQHYPGPNNTWGGRYPQQHSSAMYRNQVSPYVSPTFIKKHSKYQ